MPKRTKNQLNIFKQLSRKWLAAIVILALIIAGAFYALNRHSVNTSPSAPNTSQQKKTLADSNATDKKEFVENSNPAPAINNDQGTSSSPSAIIDLSARQETNDTVTVFTKLNSNTQGSCALTITNGSKTSTHTVNIIYQPEFSTCAGFSVPISELGAGIWNINLAVNSSAKSISLEVK